jgi:DNA polymerase-3 subunit gamma/tau
MDEGIDPNQFILSLIDYFRNAMLIKSGKELSPLIELTKDEIERIAKQTESLTTEDMLYILYSLINTNNMMRRAPSPRMPLELLAVKLSQKESIVSLDEIMQRLSALEKEAKKSNPQTVTPIIAPVENKKPAENNPPAPEPEANIDSQTMVYRIREAIPEVIKSIRQEKIYIASCLSEGKLIGFRNNILTIGFSKKNTFHKESLEKPQNKKLIDNHLSQALGTNIGVEFVIIKDETGLAVDEKLSAEKTPEEPKSPLKKAMSDPIIKSALDIFDGNIMKLM